MIQHHRQDIFKVPFEQGIACHLPCLPRDFFLLYRGILEQAKDEEKTAKSHVTGLSESFRELFFQV
jgi:hypothetical protein